jgi:hypothetical protein
MLQVICTYVGVGVRDSGGKGRGMTGVGTVADMYSYPTLR